MGANGDMKKVDKQTALEGGFFNFFKGLVSEFKRITWASKEHTKKATIAVIIFCAIYVVIVGVIDFEFNSLAKIIMK
jgi:preprotein translocase subunit SecE